MLAALFVSNAGTSLQLTAQAWLVWQTTHNLRDLGLLGLVQASPLLGLPLVGGLLAHFAYFLKVTEATLAVGDTTKMSHIPPAACPGTLRIIMYLPAFGPCRRGAQAA